MKITLPQREAMGCYERLERTFGAVTRDDTRLRTLLWLAGMRATGFLTDRHDRGIAYGDDGTVTLTLTTRQASRLAALREARP